MSTANYKWSGIVFLFLQIWMARADYQCMCTYAVETPVYPSPAQQGDPLGYMYEFDCKPVYGKNVTSGIQAVQMENKVGYVQMIGQRQIQLCQGNVPKEDKVPSTTPPPTTAPTTTGQISTTTTASSSTSQTLMTTDKRSTAAPSTSSSSMPVNISVTTASVGSTTSSTPPASPSTTGTQTSDTPSSTPITSSATTTSAGSTTSQNPTAWPSTTGTTLIQTTSASTLSPNASVASNTALLSSILSTKADVMTSTTPSASPSSGATTPFVSTTLSTILSTAANTTTTTFSTTPLNTTSATTASSSTSTMSTTLPTTSSTAAKTTKTTTTPSTTPTASTTTTTTSTPTTSTTTTSTSPATTTATTTTASTTTTPTTTPTPKRVPDCKVGWTLYNGSCYLFHTSSRVNWRTANSACASYHAHLVFVESYDEDMFLRNELAQHMDSDIDDSSDSGVWMGGTDDDREGKWVWHNGFTGSNTHLGSFNRWQDGEPDSGENDHDEDCMTMIGEHGYKWNDYSCNKHMFYVCETNPSITTQAVSSSSCPPGWFAYQTSCYYFSAGHRVHWSTAASSCLADQAHLAILETQGENTFLKKVLTHLVNTDDAGDSDTGVWLGGTDSDTEGKWMWHNAVTGADTQIGPYNNWRPGQPDAGDGQKEEDCMCMIGDKGFVWEDYRCNKDMFYVCEKGMPTNSQPGTNKYALSCAGGWTLHQDSCYLFSHSDHLEWDDAADKCRDSDAYLVMIGSLDEQTFLANQMKHIIGSGSHEGFWAGGTDEHHEGSWVWKNTMSRHEAGPLNGYTHWRHGYPEHGGEDCLAMFGSSNFQWQDYRCKNNIYHVCEKSALAMNAYLRHRTRYIPLTLILPIATSSRACKQCRPR